MQSNTTRARRAHLAMSKRAVGAVNALRAMRAAPLALALALMLGLTAQARADGAAHGAHGHDDATAAIGEPGNAKRATRTVNIDMADNMRFTPATVSVKRGETVRFVVNNRGRLRHEMTLGTAASLAEHAKMMQSMPTMKHEEANAVTVEPGASGTLVWHFTKDGTVDFACLEPGHFEAGMKGAVSVTK